MLDGVGRCCPGLYKSLSLAVAGACRKQPAAELSSGTCGWLKSLQRSSQMPQAVGGDWGSQGIPSSPAQQQWVEEPGWAGLGRRACLRLCRGRCQRSVHGKLGEATGKGLKQGYQTRKSAHRGGAIWESQTGPGSGFHSSPSSPVLGVSFQCMVANGRPNLLSSRAVALQVGSFTASGPAPV